MSKITADQLLAPPLFMSVSQPPAKFIAIMRVGDDNTALPSALNN